MIQHFTTFRKPNRLSGQAPVVLTKRKIFPLDKRSAYVIHVNQLKGHDQDRKEEGFHRRQREGRHFNNSADWGDEAANIISSIVMEHTYGNRY